MRLLLSNDDGYQADGLAALARALADLAEITVVAPDRNQSGASHSLTLEVPLRVGKTREGVHYVNGTPTDCVHLAITGLLEHEPDMVIAGINHGANLGDDVLYSGTVAAAAEGRFLGLPAIAVSLTGFALVAASGLPTRSSMSMFRTFLPASCAAFGPRGSATATVRKPWSRPAIRKAAGFTGWEPPARDRTRVPGRIFMPSSTASCR